MMCKTGPPARNKNKNEMSVFTAYMKLSVTYSRIVYVLLGIFLLKIQDLGMKIPQFKGV